MEQRYIICPWCHSEMECRDHNGVEIDQCPNCFGVWLDQGELETIAKQSAEPAASRHPAACAGDASATRVEVRTDLFEWF